MTGFEDAIALIGRGGIVAVPTDTVYGLVCAPGDAAAIDRVYAIKRRPASLELTILGASVDAFAGIVEMTADARTLAAAFWPGALSMVLPVRARIWSVPRTGDTLSCRIPDHTGLIDMLRRTGPLASTSANHHGEPPAHTAGEVRAALGEEIDGVVDGDPALGRPSTIIDCTTTPPCVLRPGPISADALRAQLGGPVSERTEG